MNVSSTVVLEILSSKNNDSVMHKNYFKIYIIKIQVRNLRNNFIMIIFTVPVKTEISEISDILVMLNRYMMFIYRVESYRVDTTRRGHTCASAGGVKQAQARVSCPVPGWRRRLEAVLQHGHGGEAAGEVRDSAVVGAGLSWALEPGSCGLAVVALASTGPGHTGTRQHCTGHRLKYL